MSEEHRWNGENEENKNTADNSQETENRKDITGEDGETHGYYQINRNSFPEGTSQDSGTEESQNVTYHYSYRNQNTGRRESSARKTDFQYNPTGASDNSWHQSRAGAQNYSYGGPKSGRVNTGSAQESGRYGEYPRYSAVGAGGQGNPQTDRGRNKTARRFGGTIALAVVFGLVAAVVFQGANRISNRIFPQENTSTLSHTETAKSAGENDSASDSGTDTSMDAYTVADVARSAMPSVVAITAVSVQELPNFFGFGGQEYDSVSSGSGIIVGENDTELLIATNNHVIEGAKNLSVCFIGDEVPNPNETQEMANSGLDMENAVSAKTKGTDAGNDLAVISVRKSDIPSDTMSEIKIAQQGDAEKLVVGEQVVAIGNAMGYGQSVTSGWISALDRTIDSSESALIQTDAAINPGNSGGALLNMKGELVGINSAKFVDSTVEGMGFAIPISTAAPILEELMSQETRDVVEAEEMGYLGIQPLDISSEMIQMYNMPEGVFVSEVLEDTGAEDAGMKQGDIITKIEKQSITTSDQLRDKLQYYRAGETIEVVIQRSDSGEYQEMTLQVALGERPEE